MSASLYCYYYNIDSLCSHNKRGGQYDAAAMLQEQQHVAAAPVALPLDVAANYLLLKGVLLSVDIVDDDGCMQ